MNVIVGSPASVNAMLIEKTDEKGRIGKE